MSAVCKCGKVCKNPPGLKIHQTKMGCLRKPVVYHSIVPYTAPGETEEDPGPDTPHSAQNLHAPQATPRSRPSEHRWILWPAANKESEWQQFDEDVDKALEATAKGDVDQRLKTLSTFIISIAFDRFGTKEQRDTKTTIAAPIPNRREIKISQLRQELRVLRSQHSKASNEEKAALAKLRSAVPSLQIHLDSQRSWTLPLATSSVWRRERTKKSTFTAYCRTPGRS